MIDKTSQCKKVGMACLTVLDMPCIHLDRSVRYLNVGMILKHGYLFAVVVFMTIWNLEVAVKMWDRVVNHLPISGIILIMGKMSFNRLLYGLGQ